MQHHQRSTFISCCYVLFLVAAKLLACPLLLCHYASLSVTSMQWLSYTWPNSSKHSTLVQQAWKLDNMHVQCNKQLLCIVCIVC